MYYRGKYTYRNPRFVDLSWTPGAIRLDSGWMAGLAASGFVIESPRGRQYLIEYSDADYGSAALLNDLYHLHPDPDQFEVLQPKIHPRFQVRIIQKSSRPGVYRGVVNRRLTAAAQTKLIKSIRDFVNEKR